jgi:NADP-dependent 3-hydroxy acid dehydrogenase YdfG
VLVNNAGIAAAGVSEAFTPDQAEIVFNTNVVGLLRTTRAVLPAMRGQGDGLIINIGSILGRVPSHSSVSTTPASSPCPSRHRRTSPKCP